MIGTARPGSRTSPKGCSLVSLQVSDPNPDPLKMVLLAVDVETAVTEGASRMTVTLQCPKGRVTF